MVRFLIGGKVFLVSKMSEQSLVPTQPSIRLVPVAKWPGREAEHLPSSVA